MDTFPRTTVGGVSLSRMIIGTNWFLGYSHTTRAKDNFITENIADRRKIADILEVYLRAGVDTIMGQIQHLPLADAIKEAAGSHRHGCHHRLDAWLPDRRRDTP